MEYHLVKRDVGYMIVDRIAGPYSHSEPTDVDVLALSEADLIRFRVENKPAAMPPAAAATTDKTEGAP